MLHARKYRILSHVFVTEFCHCKYYHKINIFALCPDCEKGSDFRGFPRQFVQDLFSAFRSLQRLLPDAAPSAQDDP